MPVEQEEAVRVDDFDENEAKVLAKKNSRELDRRKQELDKRINKIRAEAKKCYLEYGPDHDNTDFMMNLLNVTLEMKECIDSISAVGLAIEYLQDVVGVIDGVFKLSDDLSKSLSNRKQGFFRRLIQRIKNKRDARRLANKMFATFELISDNMEMLEKLRDAMSGATAKMRKRREKRRQKKARKNKNTGGEQRNRALELVLSDIEADQNGGSTGTTSGGGSAPSGGNFSGGGYTPSGGSRSGRKSSESGVDDL